MSSVLVVGGALDPNVSAIVETLQLTGVEVFPLLVGEGENPALHWDFLRGEVSLNNKPLDCSGAFCRWDVFHENRADARYRALAWFEVIQGWLSTRPGVRILNREFLGKRTNKLHVLHLAQKVGFSIPATLVSNDMRRLKAWQVSTGSVVKPVTGGGYCKSIEEVVSQTELNDGVAASPAIVQRKLTGPDVRIYGIDNTFITFRIHADKIDYRESHRREIEPMEQPPDNIIQSLKHLMAAMGLNWCAADFKTDLETGQLIFLEINSNPMFTVFDKVAQRRITKAIAGFFMN